MDKGSYVYEDNDTDIILFIYIKLSKDKLKRALPLSYNENTIGDCNYLLACFKNGFDYLSCGTYETILEMITKHNMVDIINNDYISISKYYKNLTINDYNHYLSFATKQLKI